MPNDLPLEGETSPAELTTWISQHLDRGAAPDQITTELVSFGWTRESASSIVNATRDSMTNDSWSAREEEFVNARWERSVAHQLVKSLPLCTKR